jgi:hypothetical protein
VALFAVTRRLPSVKARMFLNLTVEGERLDVGTASRIAVSSRGSQQCHLVERIDTSKKFETFSIVQVPSPLV